MAPAADENSAPASAPIPEAPSAGPVLKPRTVGTASTFTFLQSMVTVALSYQLLFSTKTDYAIEALELVIVGLLLIVVSVMFVPNNWWRTRLVVGGAILANTILCANIFYMSGLADPGLYVTLVLLVVVAAYSASANQHIALSLALCVGYGIVWYIMGGRSGPVAQGDLLRFPVLFTMANFYWHVLGLRARSHGA